jgi:hypothetical protein
MNKRSLKPRDPLFIVHPSSFIVLFVMIINRRPRPPCYLV